jgi:hypothetical protein
VLEHILDPLAFLKQLSPHLKETGKFIIEIPNRNTVWLKIFKGHYNQLGVPFHLSHFTPEAFRRAFAPHFTIHSIKHANIPVLGPSLSLRFGARTSNIGPLAAVLYPLQLLVDKITGTSTALIIEMSNK